MNSTCNDVSRPRSGTTANSLASAVPATIALAVALTCLFAGKVGANPTGAEVVAGQASLVSSPNKLLITNSPGAIINWQSFSILPGELTQFIQQSSSSSVLNRITGQDPTQILGALQSNGKVVLINPNGILFGTGARVDVNGLMASTLNLSNADFLAGKFRFSGNGTSGDVSNQGAITTPGGGQVYLIGSSVTNGGVITSPGGDVVLAAGQSVDLADSNDPDVRVVISASGNEALNVGQVVAETGRVGIYGALVNQMGLVSANSAVLGANGRIVLKSSGDTILGAGSVTTATGAGTGGAIELTGGRVGLVDDAVIDVSGQSGGGTVLVGGDERGGNAAIRNASLTYMGALAQIKADALQSGNGGKVIIWSDQQTQMYGNVSARGGNLGGNGGFVETSSKGHLDFHGVVDLRAPSGAAGTLLLDPSDITIQAGASSGDVIIPGTAPFDITAANDTSVLSISDLQNALTLGNVTVTTSSAASAPSGGTITVASALAWANSNALSLVADNGIAINAPITAPDGTLHLTTASGDITQSGGPVTAAAVTAVASGGAVKLNDPGNEIALIAGSANGMFGFSLVNAGSFAVGIVPGFGLTPSVSGITSTSASAAYGVVLQTSAGGDITIAAPIDAGDSNVLVGADGKVVQGTDGLITGDDLIVGAGTAAGIGSSDAPLRTAVNTLRSANSLGPVHISNSGGLMVNFINADGAVRVNASGPLTTPIPASCDCTPAIEGSSVVLTADGSMLLNAGGHITATNGVALHAGYDSASGTYLSSDNTLTVDSEVSGSTIGLFSSGAIATSGTLTGVVTETPSLSPGSPEPPPLPALSACIATPTLLGCSAVLPTLGSCTASPLTAGCSVVLPSLAACVTLPATAGCSAVLPSLASCTANPVAAGCSVILPTLAACVAWPTTAGCAVVLPTLAQCTAAPTLAGCSVILPPVSACVSNPTAPGCVVVVPPTTVSTVTQVSDVIVVSVNTPGRSTTTQASPSPSSGGPAPGSEKNDSSAEAKSDKSSDAKKTELVSEKTEVAKNAPPPKTFCN